MAYRRLQLARMLLGSGLHRAWPRVAPASLIVVNYHRLWPASASGPSQFDDGVFGPDADEFRRQIEWLKSETEMLDEQGLIDLARATELPRRTVYSAVTFDDAYIDCYSIARPILDSLGIRAIFFVPVGMVESRQLGWWDLAAYLLKRSNRETIRVRDEVLHLRADLLGSLKRVLRIFKLEPVHLTEGLLDELSSVCGVPLPDKDCQSAELMSWDQIRAMHADGHGIGSHTLSHRVLATLAPQEQALEIRESRRQLKAILGADVRSFAYPVGGTQHYDKASVALAREAGYEQAFTFNTGIEKLPIVDRFQIGRESAHSFELLEAKVLLPSLMGICQKQAV